MDEFIGETIDVERSLDAPRPARFRWRGEVHEVAQVLAEWIDTGHGELPRRSRKWYTRRHRRCFVVRDAAGATFEMYFDYSDKTHPTWFLTRRIG